MTDLPLCGQSAFIVLWIGAAICVAIFATMVYSIISFCKSSSSNTAKFTQRAYVEVIWAVIPILILIVTATPAVKPLVGIGQGCSQVSAVASR